MMRLTTIGTGTAAPTPTRVCAGHLVEMGSVRLLLDCGSGVVHRMAGLGIEWGAISHVALTHFDNDHISDLATLFVAWRWGQTPPRTAPVEVIGPPGLRGLLERMSTVLWDKLLDPGYPVSIRELADGETADLGDGVSLAARRVPHTPESVAYSVNRAAHRIVYTGDTGFDATFGDWAAGCDVLLCECSLPATLGIPMHLTPEQAADIAATARPGLLVLTHLYPPVEREDLRAIVGARFTGEMVVATDGWFVDFDDRIA